MDIPDTQILQYFSSCNVLSSPQKNLSSTRNGPEGCSSIVQLFNSKLFQVLFTGFMVKWNMYVKEKYNKLKIRRFQLIMVWKVSDFWYFMLYICIYVCSLDVMTGDVLEYVLLALCKENLFITYISFIHRKIFSKRFFPSEIN